MKLFAGLIALTLAVPGLAHAAGNLSGTYDLRYTTLCQSIENEIFAKNGTGQIDTIDEGKISQTVGTITFTPSSGEALSGTVTANLTQASGSLAILGLPGGSGQPAQPAVPDMQISSGTQTGTYALTLTAAGKPSTLKITFKGSKVETFSAYLSKLSGTVFGRANFVNLDGSVGGKPNCTNAGSADHE